jgi:tetratricopeptide (TPR) repeat protein
VRRGFGKKKEALTQPTSAAAEAPALLSVHSALGHLELELGRDREARAQLRQVIDAGKASAEDRLAFATAVIHLGMVREGEKALAEAASAGGAKDRIARLHLVLQSWKGPKEAGIAAKALEKLRRGAKKGDADSALDIANAWRRAGDPARAEAELRAAMPADPLHANLGLGRIALARNDAASAQGFYRAALAAWERGPYGVDDASEGRVGLARALLVLKKSEEAVKTLETAVTADPTAPEVHYWFGRALAERGELEQARAQAGKAVELDDHYAEAYLLLGDLTKSSDRKRARQAYRHFLDLNSDAAQARLVKKTLESLR